jgi:hypothetical protein
MGRRRSRLPAISAQSRESRRDSVSAEYTGFELLLTTDRRIRYQQNLQVRRITLVVLTGSTGRQLSAPAGELASVPDGRSDGRHASALAKA